MFRCLHAGDLDAVVCPELVADGGLSHYLLSVHEACSRPTAAVRFESEPAGAEVKTPSGQSCRTPCELTIQVAPELSVTFALAGYESETVSVRSEEGSVFSSPKLTPNPVHVALHMIPAVPAKKKIR